MGATCSWMIVLSVSSFKASLFWYWAVSVVIHVGGLSRWRPHRRWSLLASWGKGVEEGLVCLLLSVKYANPWLWVPQIQYMYMCQFHLSDPIQWKQNYLGDAPVLCCAVIHCHAWSESYCLILAPAEQWLASQPASFLNYRLFTLDTPFHSLQAGILLW